MIPPKRFKSAQPWAPAVAKLQARGLVSCSLSELVRYADYMADAKPLIAEAVRAGLVLAVVECWLDEKNEPHLLDDKTSIAPKSWRYNYYPLSVAELITRSLPSVDGLAYMPDWLHVAMSTRFNRPGLLEELQADRKLRESVCAVWTLCIASEGSDAERSRKGLAAVRQLLGKET